MPKKIKILSGFAAGIFILVLLLLLAAYYFGQPDKDHIGYGSKFYVIDRCNENIYLVFSGNNYSHAHKRIMLLEERKNEFSAISNPEELAEFQQNISQSYSIIEKYISKISDNSKQNILRRELVEAMLGLLYQNSQNCTAGTCTSDTIKDIVQKISQSTSQLPEDQQRDIVTRNQDLINAIGANSQNSITSLGSVPADDNATPEDNNDNNGTQNGESGFYSISTISKEQIDALIKTQYQGDYIFKTTNVLKDKGYVASSIAIPDNFSALFIIKNTADGLAIDMLIDDDDYSQSTKPQALTDAEWQWLLYNVDYNHEDAINYN